MRTLALLVGIGLAAWAQAPSVSLDGNWQMLPDPHAQFQAGALPASGWRSAQVPLSIQAQFPDLRDFAGRAWFRRSFERPALTKGERLLLHFGAVDFEATVRVNGALVGTHEGGYTPFDLDITAATRTGPNAVLLEVFDPGDRAAYAQIPHGKQNWYVQTTGLWQSVTLAVKPPAYMEWVHALSPSARLSGFELQLAHPEALPANVRATVVLTAPDGAVIRRSFPLARSKNQTLPFSLPDAQFWSPQHPRLYQFAVSLSNGDSLAGRFGLRTIATRGGRIFLNGEPVYLRGALDQAFYPDGVYTPPSKEYLVSEMDQAKRLGLNLLRLHIKTPDPRYLEAADETGMLVWYEIPNWDRLTPASDVRAKALFEGALARDWNHPAIIAQSIINESWGADLSQAADRSWLSATAAWARSQVPDRLIVDNSACCGNFHLSTDLADFHKYNAIPDHAAAWDDWVADFAARPAWLFSPHGDAQPRGNEPLVVSEFGNWGLPDLPAQRPWWFARGFGRNPITLPAGVDTRMHAAGLDRAVGGYAGLASATQQHEWQALRHEIESLRLHPSIQGYVITEFTDVNWESNGLLTMWRQPKLFADRLTALQQPIVAIAQAEGDSFAPGDRALITFWVSNESPKALRGAQIEVEGQTLAVPDVDAGAVVESGSVRLAIDRAANGPLQMPFELVASDGGVLNQRSLDLTVVAAPAGGAQADVVGSWAEAARRAAAGESVVLVAPNAAALAGVPLLQYLPRKGDLSGDWISNFNWLDTSRPPFQQFAALGPILGRGSASITPEAVLGGVPAANTSDILAGFFLGWVHDANALVVQARHGTGKIVITTLNLDLGTQDPFAAAVLAALRRYAASPACAPGLTL